MLESEQSNHPIEELKATDEQQQKLERLKVKADLKRNIIDAVASKNVVSLVAAVQAARRFIFATTEMNPDVYKQGTIDLKDGLHVSDDAWATQIRVYFDSNYTNLMLHLDSVSRLNISNDGSGNINVVVTGAGVPGVTTSSLGAMTQWRLIEDAYDFMYGDEH